MFFIELTYNIEIYKIVFFDKEESKNDKKA